MGRTYVLLNCDFICFQDEKKVDLDLNSSSVSLRALPALCDDAETAVSTTESGVAAEDVGVVEHPEILVSRIFMEKLGLNECLKVRYPSARGMIPRAHYTGTRNPNNFQLSQSLTYARSDAQDFDARFR